MSEFSTVLHALAYWAEQTPDKTVLVDGETGRSCTYSELWRWSVAFSRKIKAAVGAGGSDGLGPRVVVRVGGMLETYTAAFGIFLGGGIYCPVERHMKPQKMLEMLDYYDATLYVSSEKLTSGAVYMDMGTVIDDAEEFADAAICVEPEAIAAIIFSTGTTGKAKGITHSFRTLYYSAEIVRENHQFRQDDVFCWIQPFDRPVCYKAVFGMFHVGGTVIHVNGPIFTRTLFAAFTQYSVSILQIQAIGLSIIFERAADEFFKIAGNLRVLTVIGSALSQEYKKKLIQGLPDTMLNVQYGATEITTISYYEFSKKIGKPNCVGKVSPRNDVKIVNEDWTEIQDSSINNMGIIAVAGPSLTHGYWKAPELNQAVLKDGYIMMTDMGYFDQERNLYVVGRRDDVIVTGGYKVAPYEIEDAAMSYGGIAECVAIGIPDTIMKNVPNLYVKMQTGVEFSARDIYNHLSANLETFKLPRLISEVDDFPRMGSNQKINRNEMKKYA